MTGAAKEKAVADLRTRLADRPDLLEGFTRLYEQGYIEPAMVGDSFGWRLTELGRTAKV